MEKNKEYLKKGFYNHRQPQGFPIVKQYILTEKNGKRCLLLRLSNETEYRISCLGLALTQYDASGKVIGKSKVKYNSIDFMPGSTYSHNKGIVILDECTDFKVDVLYFICGKYKYVSKNNMTFATYDTRGYEDLPIMAKGETGAIVKRIKNGTLAFKFAALVALLLLAGVCTLNFIVQESWLDYLTGGLDGGVYTVNVDKDKVL